MISSGPFFLHLGEFMPRKVIYKDYIIQVLGFEKFIKRKTSSGSYSWFAHPKDYLRNPKFMRLSNDEKVVMMLILELCCTEVVLFSTDVVPELYLTGEFLGTFAGLKNSKQYNVLKNLNDIGFLILKSTRARENVCSTVQEQNTNSTKQNKTIVPSEKKAPDLKLIFDFESIYQNYPKRKGHMNKARGMTICNKIFKTQESYDRLSKSVENYSAFCKSNAKVGTEFIPMWSSFVNGPWEEWIDPKNLEGETAGIDWPQFWKNQNESKSLSETN